MYDFLRGRLFRKELTSVVLDVNGVGYMVYIPLNVYSKLASQGEEVTLYTSFVIREAFQALYGFLDLQDRELFEILISISGIGPKTAISLLGHMTSQQLHQALMTKELALIMKVPGIGKKTAERLLLELQDKWDITPVVGHCSPKATIVQDAKKALLNLGYSGARLDTAVEKSFEELPKDASISTLISFSLARLK